MLALAHLHSDSILLARRCAKRSVQINSDLDTAMKVYKATKLIMSTQQVDFGEKHFIAMSNHIYLSSIVILKCTSRGYFG